VVLGTLQVLRTNALGTARTVVRAIAGNAVGVAAGAALVIGATNRPALLWALLPVAVFLAAYTAGSQRFLLSQAAFTVNLMIIFNLLAPVGWRLGLIRLVDVAVGVAVSAALSLLLWPHGARRQFIRSAADYYRVVVGQLRHAFDRVLAAGATERPPAAPLGVRARAELALGDYLAERPTGPLDPPSAVVLLAGANYLALAAHLMEDATDEYGYRADRCPEHAHAVRAAQQPLLDGLARLADALAGVGRPPPRPALPDPAAAVAGCLDRWRADERAGGSVLALVVATEWTRSIDRLDDDLAGAVARAVAAAGRPWWR
jgi:uncharacterized membrane protein YccC